MHSLNSDYKTKLKMDKTRLKDLIASLKSAVEALESEVYSDSSSYLPTELDYDEVLKYYQTNDDDEEGL